MRTGLMPYRAQMVDMPDGAARATRCSRRLGNGRDLPRVVGRLEKTSSVST